MKYYVFGLPNKKNNMEIELKFKASDRLNLDENNYEAAVQEFYRVDLAKYCYAFLVVDFEMVGDISLFGYRSDYDTTDNIVPFIVLGERSNMVVSFSNNDAIMNCDNISVITSGFKQEFNDNREAFEKFLHFKRTGIKAEMNCRIPENGEQKICHIISTDDMRFKKPKPIKRFKIHCKTVMSMAEDYD